MRRRAVGVLALVVALLSACTAGSAPAGTTTPDPGAAAATPPPESPATATPTPAVTSSATATPGLVSTEELACAAADEHVLFWLRERVGGEVPASDVVMVEVGPGEEPTQTWWVVAARSYSDSWGGPGYNPISFLTTAPAGAVDADWIAIGRALQAPEGSTDWSNVSWTGDRLARGQQAQALALSCLDAPR